ncbi:MAG TPA: hypothetical protein PLC81_03915 [Bacteroidales bacterium]|nr:hypothetical protein [Bacteroidales bacterium]HQH41530.1 hypothetical protein [Bacteroidales bacterium]HQK36758.1 hypothetical protein [Bacteroidales bacterium]
MKRKQKDPELLRKYRQSVLFNKREIAAINKYCSRYKINNRSRFMREAIISEVLRRFDRDYPSLFDQPGVQAGNL